MNIINFFSFIDLRDSQWWVAMGTLALAAATFWNLKQYKNREKRIENREIAEKIIQPLQENLKKIIKGFLKGGNNTDSTYWEWERIKKENSVLIYKIDLKIKEKIEKFNKNWQSFQRQYPCYRYKNFIYELNERLCRALVNYFQKQNFSKIPQELLSILSIVSVNSINHPKNINLLYAWTLQYEGREIFNTPLLSEASINFFELIFFDISPQALLRKKEIDDKIFNIKCYIRYSITGNELALKTIEIEREDWEKIANFIREEIKKPENKKYKEYFDYSKKVYNEAKNLNKDFKKYISELIKK